MKTTGKSRIIKNKNGFSFIEVMIAMGILSIGILAVAAMQLHAAKGNRSAGLRAQAVAITSEKMEELSAVGYAHADLAIGTHSESDGHFDLTWTVSNGSTSGTKTIDMTVEWNGGRDTADFNHIIADLD